MGRGITDPNQTAVQAEREGVSRRTIQRRLKKAKEAAQADLQAHRPQQMVIPSIVPDLVPPLKLEDPKRISAHDCAARAGALERAVFRRLAEAVENGEPASVRLYAGAWKEVLGGIRDLEKMAYEVDRVMSEADWVLKEYKWKQGLEPIVPVET